MGGNSSTSGHIELSPPVRVLCIDIEGGHGGSSRSLYYSLKYIDRARIEPTVWYRRSGPIRELYQALDIPVSFEPLLPKASALPKYSRNIWQLVQHANQFRKAIGKPLNRLKDTVRAHDIVHFNHEAYATLAYWLRTKTQTPATMHIRTNVEETLFARLQMRLISRSVDRVAFITDNEEKTFRAFGGVTNGQVIRNIVEPFDPNDVTPLVPRGDRFTIASLSNVAWQRGSDRLLDVALHLKKLGGGNIRFLIAGDQTLKGSWPQPLKKIAARNGTLQDATSEYGLGDMFMFLGHVEEPERVLAAANVLIKPTRDNNPWGRDIIEGMAASLPVISVGTDKTFVETNVTGLLQPVFDAKEVAEFALKLSTDQDLLSKMGAAARARVSNLCNGPDRANDLANMWCSLAHAKSS